MLLRIGRVFAIIQAILGLVLTVLTIFLATKEVALMFMLYTLASFALERLFDRAIRLYNTQLQILDKEAQEGHEYD